MNGLMNGGGLYLEKDGDSSRLDTKHLVPSSAFIYLNEVSNDERPLFIVHPIEGVTTCLEEMASHLPFPVVGLQLVPSAPLTSVEALAGFYLQQVKQVQAEGPYRLAGYSFGCCVAFEMALQLQASFPERPGIVGSLVMLDGSHLYVKTHTGFYRQRASQQQQQHSEAEAEAMGLYAFMSRFSTSKDYIRVKEEIASADSYSGRLSKVTDMLMSTGRFSSRQDVATAANAFFRCLFIGDKYQPQGRVHRDVHLVRAKDHSLETNDLDSTYQLQAVCDGNVTVDVVDGDHESFIHQESAVKVANLISTYVNKDCQQ